MDLVEFLTSKEIIVVYIVAALACLLCFIIYLVEKHNDRGRKRHNTRELNKLVEQVKEEVEIQDEPIYEEPVLEIIDEGSKTSEVSTVVEQKVEEPIATIEEPITTEILEPINEVEVLEVNEVKNDNIEYVAVEPDIETAKEELQKITEELKIQEEKIEDVVENATMTSYEEEQEKTAIISLEELVKKSKEMYEVNELTQYSDEGNEPISINELEKIAGREAEPVTESFVISNVVPKEEIDNVMEIKEESLQTKVVLDDFNTIKTNEVKEVKKFKSSPIISPIFGIEKKEVVNDLELENTANYEKLDAEIKKTNEFLMTLKELQNKLD